MTLKVYECDACKKTIKDPYEVKMKEFYAGCSFENYGIFPSNDKRKVKIHLCDDCFKGLNKITVDECYTIHNELKKEFPNNEIITIPCSSYIETMDKESVIKYLKQIIEKLEGEPKDE